MAAIVGMRTLGEDLANGLVFRLALEAEASEGVDRMVFLALHGGEEQGECFWPVPLDEKPEPALSTGLGQMQLLTENDTSSRTDVAAKAHRLRTKAAR